MISSALSALAFSSSGFIAPVYVLLLCILGVPALVSLAVMSYVLSKEVKPEQATHEGSEEEHAALTRRWLAERYVPCALERCIFHSIASQVCTASMAEQMTNSCCVVCLAPFEAGELLKVLPPCQHAFHVACIDKWFGSNSTCPLCRCQGQVGRASRESQLAHPHYIWWQIILAAGWQCGNALDGFVEDLANFGVATQIRAWLHVASRPTSSQATAYK